MSEYAKCLDVLFVVWFVAWILKSFYNFYTYGSSIAAFIFLGVAMISLVPWFCACLGCVVEKWSNLSTKPREGRIVSSTDNSNPELPQSSVPEPVFESVVVKEQISEDKDHPPAYDEVILNPLQLEASPQISEPVNLQNTLSEETDHPPSFDEVIEDPPKLEESEVCSNGSSHTPPSYEPNEIQNKRNEIYIMNLAPEESPVPNSTSLSAGDEVGSRDSCRIILNVQYGN